MKDPLDTFTMEMLSNLRNYIVNIKAEIEDDGLIPTADEILLRLDKVLLELKNEENESIS